MEQLWSESPRELKNLVREWTLAQTGIVRAYTNGEISRQKYTALKKKLEYALNLLETMYV